jgi:hypothetical protein
LPTLPSTHGAATSSNAETKREGEHCEREPRRPQLESEHHSSDENEECGDAGEQGLLPERISDQQQRHARENDNHEDRPHHLERYPSTLNRSQLAAASANVAVPDQLPGRECRYSTERAGRPYLDVAASR